MSTFIYGVRADYNSSTDNKQTTTLSIFLRLVKIGLMTYETHLTTITVFLLAIILVLLFHLRNKWLPPFRAWLSRRRIRLEGYSGLSSFSNDIESGLTSDHFDLREHNLNDSREGLDENSKKKILQIMEEEHLTFDEARLKFTKQSFSENNIGPDGMPLDPKAVTFHK